MSWCYIQLLTTIIVLQLIIYIYIYIYLYSLLILYNTISASSRFILMYAVSLAHLQVPEWYNGSTVPTSAGPEATLPGVLVHVLPQDRLLTLLKCALHPCLGALV